MKNLHFALSFLLLFFSLAANGQTYLKDWKFDSAQNNLTIKVSPRNAKIYLLFDSKQSLLLTRFMEKGEQAGVFNQPILVNGKPFTGKLSGRLEGKKTSFACTLKKGERDGIASFTDRRGVTTEKTYLYLQVEEPIEHRNVKEKPIIYLYPTEKTEISVKLNFNQKQLKHTYPKYNPEKGWNVIAEPNGNLKNVENGKDYYALFWEGESQKLTEIKQGFVVKGENTADFLEEKLAVLGLNWRESNEFIMYWLPQMENNNYNLIHFSTEEYTRDFPITITPRPDNFIRVFMVFEPLEKAIEIPTQELTPAKRGGFTAVEWGGTKQEKPKF